MSVDSSTRRAWALANHCLLPLTPFCRPQLVDAGEKHGWISAREAATASEDTSGNRKQQIPKDIAVGYRVTTEAVNSSSAARKANRAEGQSLLDQTRTQQTRPPWFRTPRHNQLTLKSLLNRSEIMARGTPQAQLLELPSLMLSTSLS